MITFFKRILIFSSFLLFAVLPLLGQDDFSSFMSDEEFPELRWSGKGSLITKYNSNYNSILESKIDILPKIDLNLDYIDVRSEFHGKISYVNLQGNSASSLLTGEFIEEAYFRLFFDKFDIEAGYMKIIWGKGDQDFTFDNLNAIDYTDFINTSYLDRKIAEPMVKLNIPVGMQGMVEAVYTPIFTHDIYPSTEEDWNQNKYSLSEDTSRVENSQFGLRITNSPLGIDLGVSYQYTFVREPVLDEVTAEGLSSDRVHLFGFETAFVILGFNIRSEAAYYMTPDLTGDDPLVHNNKALFLIGFDRDLLVHNLLLNIQSRGELKLGSDKIDVSDIITGGLRDSFFNEKITAELNGTYTIEDKDFMIIPEIRINLIEDTWLNVKYTFFYGDSDTLFGQFEDNDFLEMRMEYSF